MEAIAVADSGTVYVGGSFTRLGPMTGGGVPVDGVNGVPAASFAAVDGAVYAVSPDGAGGWYVGGSFARVGGQPRRNLAHVLADGSLDPNWAPATETTSMAGGSTNWVRALAFENGVLYVAGAFDTLGGVARPGIGAVDGTGTITDWAPAITPAWGVYALAPHGPTVYLGGLFTAVGGQARAGLAAVDVAGNVTDWNPNGGTTPSTYQAWITTMVVVGDVVYVGGEFDHIGGQPRSGLAAVNATGVTTGWDPGLELPANIGGNPFVEALAAENGTLYVGGKFGQVQGQPRSALAAFDSQGRLTAWAPHLDDPFVDGLAVSGGTVYVSGQFAQAGGVPRSHFAAFDATGAATQWDPDADEGYGHVLSVSGNQVYAAGSFKWLGKATKRAGLGAIDPNGRVTDWNPGLGTGTVHAIAVDGATIYVGGEFSEVGGQQRANVAAIDATGSATAWNPGVGGPVYALAVGNGLVYLAGGFSAVGGHPRQALAAVEPSGNVTGWRPEANAFVASLALDGTTLYAGGYFTAVGGVARTNLAAIHALSGQPLAWSPAPGGSYGFAGPVNSTSPPPGVWAVVANAGTVYFVGDFKSVDGLPRDRIAAADASGKVTPFDVSVLPIFNQAHTVSWGLNRVLVGGTLDSNIVDGSLFTPSLAMVDADSSASFASAWSVMVSETPGGLADSPFVQAIAVHGDVAYLGGHFWGYDVSARRWGLAALDANGNLTSWDPNAFP